MNRRSILSISAIAALGLALLPVSAVAQQKTLKEQLAGSWTEVRECHMIRGGGDFLLKLVARDTAHENQLTQKLTGLPTVSRVQTLQTIRTSLSLSGVPL